MSEWQPIDTAPKDVEVMFFQSGNKDAWAVGARRDRMRVDIFSEEWTRGRHQYPEAPYTHWMPLPEPPR